MTQIMFTYKYDFSIPFLLENLSKYLTKLHDFVFQGMLWMFHVSFEQKI